MTDTESIRDVFEAYRDPIRLVSGGWVAPSWSIDGMSLWYAEGAPEDAVIVRVDLATGEAGPVFNTETVRASLAAATGHEPPYRGLPFERFALTRDGKLEFDYEAGRWRLDPRTHQVEPVGAVSGFMKVLGWLSQPASGAAVWQRSDYLGLTSEVPEQRSPDGEWLASVQDSNIVLRSTQPGGSLGHRLTLNGTPECAWDIEALRIRVLAGRRIGYGGVSPWSSDSLTLLAYRRDIAGVLRIPRVHWLTPFEQVERIPCQNAGGKLDVIVPVFVDVRSGRQTPLLLTEVEDRYVQLLAWHPGSGDAYIIVYARDFKRLDIIAADRATGAVRTLLTETSFTFVKVWHDAIFSGDHGFRLLPDGSGFLWLSTRDGWNHVYHYDRLGQLVAQLTSGDWPVHEISHVGPNGSVYVTASIDTSRCYDVHVCRVALAGGQLEQLTRERGIHTPEFAPGGQAFLDTHSSVDRPTQTDLVRADGTLLRVLSQMNISRLQAVGYYPAEEFTVRASDGVIDLWGVLYKPFNFDESRCYPVIEYIYGGPQTIETPRFFAVDPTMLRSMSMPWALAQLGYIVVCLDARGTPGRSKAFHDAVYGNWTVGIADHVDAIRQLCERHAWMDAHRVGIYGHSWGGYFATAALMQAPETYRAAVSYAPGYSPWDSILYEPYLDLPLRNRAAYDQADITRRAAEVTRPLLIVAGTADLHFSSAMRFTRALIDAGVDHECVVVPHAFHHFAGAEEDYLLTKLIGWFDRHVRSPQGQSSVSGVPATDTQRSDRRARAT